jgi:hypothetical protein
MNRTALITLLSQLPLAAAGVKVGTFPAEMKTAYTTEQGLPDNDVRCVALAGRAVWAGTAKGLASRTASDASWHGVDKFNASPVDACAADGDSLLFAYNGALWRIGSPDGTAKMLAKASDQNPIRALAVRDAAVYLAAGPGLFRLSAGGASLAPVSFAPGSIDVRQIAIGPTGEVAVAAREGLFTIGGAGEVRSLTPADGQRSWAPRDVRGVAYDSAGRLWFASPQGAGCRENNADTWKLYTGLEGLPYDDFTTMAPGEPGVVWFGTTKGAIRFNGSIWEYREGKRWVPDDKVRAIAVAPTSGDAWFATSAGAGVIERKPMTLAEKARFYEDEIDKRHRRTPYEYVMAVRLPKQGDKSEWTQSDSDNDGLWTAMYGAGECFAYGATKDPKTKARARKAFEALRFLSEVTQGGEHPAPPGFPARAILPTSGPDPNATHYTREADERNRAQRDHLWKVITPRWPKSADGKWYWKTDTSSDELDGHYFLYALYYDLVAETPQEKEDVRKVVRAITDHILDHNWALVDWDGKPTRWAVFDPATFNHNRLWWAGRGLNALSILSYLKVAEHLTGDAKYKKAYDTLIREHAYDTNAMVPKIQAGQGSGNQSDDEMAYMSLYGLLMYETDDDLLQKYSLALANYQAIERWELNPFFNYVAAAALTGKKFTDAYRTSDLTPRGEWLEESADSLRRMPLDRIDWRHMNSDRKDIVRLRLRNSEDDERRNVGSRRNGYAVPLDERYFNFWNHNPYSLNTGGNGHELGDGAVFLLPYYMGLYHRYIED